MPWVRTKQMPVDEWPEFRARFESLFADFKDDPGLALQVIDGPDTETITVSIPFFRSGLVETFSPGGWRDRTRSDAREINWKDNMSIPTPRGLVSAQN